MTEQLLKDPAWRRKNRLCTLLSLLPVVGWMALIFMAKRSGQRRFRIAGTIYGILSTAGYIPISLNLFFGVYVFSEIRRWFEILPFAIWLICLVHTLSLSKQYLQYLALNQASSPARDKLTSDKHWRRDNLRWMIWSIFPLCGSFAVFAIGKRLNNKTIYFTGLFSSIAIIVSSLLHTVCEIFYRYGFQDAMLFLQAFIGYVSILSLLVCFLFREDYLDVRASEWNGDTRRLPLLLDKKWRLKNSLWRVWTIFPLFGGIGLGIAGLKERNRKRILIGIICSIIYAILIVLYSIFESRYGNMYEFLSLLTYRLILLHYCAVLLYSTFVHWDVLRGRAISLQGYGSEFERDLDLYNRMSARGVDVSERQAQPVPTPESSIVDVSASSISDTVITERPIQNAPVRSLDFNARPEAVSQTPDGKIDINLCTQAELTNLPGVGVSQAMRAMEYREKNGEFRSVDEFVELLQIKPHFAVQLFTLAVAGQNAPAGDINTSESQPVRRRIDF